MIVLQKEAHAKLNLTLDILGKRPDGYHDLRMVMTSVSLSDTVKIILGTGKPWEVTADCGNIPQNEGNLCWKAARAYFDAAVLDPQGISIRLTKRIPSQAGMAGGSSDAAAVLRLLNDHYRVLSEPMLQRLALSVGSDVPYCLFGGTALAEGRGEILTRLPDLPSQMAYVLVKPDFAVSTPALFRAIDAAGTKVRPDNAAMQNAIEAGDLPAIGALLQNAFEPEIVRDYPVVEEIRQRLLANGALGARLTGTGSVVFGVFDGEAAAAQAAEALKDKYPLVLTAKNI